MVEVAPRIVVEALKNVGALVRLSVIAPPSDTAPPPMSWLPADTVRDEFARAAFAIDPFGSDTTPAATVRPFDEMRPFDAERVFAATAPVKVEVPAPVTVRPTDDARPAAVIPPEKDEVAELVFKMEPPVIVMPFDEEMPPALVDAIPPAKVEVPLLPTMVVVAVEPT